MVLLLRQEKEIDSCKKIRLIISRGWPCYKEKTKKKEMVCSHAYICVVEVLKTV